MGGAYNTSMAYRLAIFDFDGTLADSLAHAVAIFRRLAPTLGLKPFDDVAAARAMPARQLMKKLGVSYFRLPRLMRAFQAAAAEGAENLPLQPGIADMLATLHANGIRLGILSSNREDNIRACLKTHGVEHYFEFILGYPKLFGKARALRRILKAEKIPREEVIYIGDELRDIEAARKARIACAAVSWGWHVPEMLEEAMPVAMLRSPTDLVVMIEASGAMESV
jgi:phosphoglycolate phosphatase